VRLSFILLVSAALMAACGGADPPTFAETAPDAAEEALIRGDQLPLGWQEGSETTLDRVQLSRSCDLLTPEGAFPGASATATSASFETADQRGAQSFSAVFETAELAGDALVALDTRVESCREEFLDAVRDVAEEEIESQGINPGPFADIDVAIERAPLAGVGEEASVYQVRVKVSILGADREFSADVALVRKGRVVGALLYSAYRQIQDEEERAFLNLLIMRLEASDDMFP
jgi:hypothetical protein